VDYCFQCKDFPCDKLINFKNDKYEHHSIVLHLDVVSNRVTDAYIKDLMVRPEFQGQGIGTHLMNMAIKKLKEDRLYMISVVFEEKLIAFYKCFGFNLLYAG